LDEVAPEVSSGAGDEYAHYPLTIRSAV